MIVCIDCPEILADIPVPPLLLQPLAENAVKHGVARSRCAVTICVTARVEGDLLVLRVEDDADSVSQDPGLGIGTRNIAERLATLYGPRASISAGPQAQGFAVELRVPIANPQPSPSLSS